MFDLDVETIVQALRNNGHTVGYTNPLPENAGDYEFIVDDKVLTLEEVRALLETDSVS